MSEIQHYQPQTDIALPEVTDAGLDMLMKQAEAMSAAHKLATVLCNTAMVPATFRGKPDDGAAAILYGAEVGLKPQQALQQVFVVHGQPAIYARTMVALLKAKGYRFETVSTSDEAVTVRATSPRGEVEESTWTIDRAKKAGYTSNKKYTSDPQAMLYAKAASEVSRKIAPDVLLGIKYAAEDLELEPVKVTATRMDTPAPQGRGADAVRAALAAKQQETPTAAERDWMAEIQATTTHDNLNALMNEAQNADLPNEEFQVLAEAANAQWTAITEAGAQ